MNLSELIIKFWGTVYLRNLTFAAFINKRELIRLIYIITCCVVIIGCKQPETIKHEKEEVQLNNYRPLIDKEKQKYQARLSELYDSLLRQRGFNGSIIIAKNGEILLEEYNGYKNFETKDTINSRTAFHIASVSKTFTAAAILRLWEQKKLSLEDSLQVYFPQFPYHGISVRMLLNHRSGLPNYLYFMKDDTTLNNRVATNEDVIRFMMTNHPDAYNQPGRAFHYCNTNYILLATIVEKVTGKPFPVYMKDSIFAPLGMKNSFVFSINDTANYSPSYWANNTLFKFDRTIDCVYGDKNVFSTPRDLLLWDKALFNNTLLSKETYDEATQGYSFEKAGTHNYGLGWRLLLRPDSKVVYHNGWWHGNNATFTRLVADTATVIILGNRYNRNIYSGMKFATAFDSTSRDDSDLE